MENVISLASHRFAKSKGRPILVTSSHLHPVDSPEGRIDDFVRAYGEIVETRPCDSEPESA